MRARTVLSGLIGVAFIAPCAAAWGDAHRASPIPLQAMTFEEIASARAAGTGCTWLGGPGLTRRVAMKEDRGAVKRAGRIVTLRPSAGASEVFPYTYHRWTGGGMNSNDGLMIATFAYALATAALAVVTALGVRNSNEASRDNNTATIEAAGSSLTRQIEATRDITAMQIEAAATSGREQALLSAVSVNRQGWINQLRDEVAGFVAENAVLRGIGDRITDRDPQMEEKSRIHVARRRHFHKVQLLINPKEQPSVDLLSMMEAGLKQPLSPAQEDAIVVKAQAILKTEWDRVRTGE